jgi:hypothetical protein
MSQKSALKNRPERRKPRDKKSEETVVESFQSEEEISGADQFLENIKPYLGTIGLVVVAVVLAMIALAVYRSANFQTQAIRWTELNQAASIGTTTGNIGDLSRVAEENADNTAGLVASLYAARIQLRNGAAQLGVDRDAGLELIQQAKRNLVAIVEAKDQLKTPMLTQQSLYYLGYANESLGEFEEAKANYTELVESFPESPLKDDTERALKRCTPEFAALYKVFEKFEAEVIGDAPGPGLTDPDRPSSAISEFDDLELPTGQNAPGKKQDSGEGDAQGEGTADADDAGSEKAAEMKPAEGESAQPKATEKPAEGGKPEATAKESDPPKAESSGDQQPPANEQKPEPENATQQPAPKKTESESTEAGSKAKPESGSSESGKPSEKPATAGTEGGQ